MIVPVRAAPVLAATVKVAGPLASNNPEASGTVIHEA
jgi:hypothetical protein